MRLKEKIIDMINEARERRAYDLKRGYKFFKNYKRTDQTLLDILTTIAENNLRVIQGLIN